jgi:serine phosphatase RsbU (regulator of sigma subunit)
VIELKGDKQPISAALDTEKKRFGNHEFLLQKNDHIYLFTDGYADQFGGPKEKKLSYRNLKEMLRENSSKELSAQKASLEQAFDKWRGSLEQVDDVCVVGIRI